MSTKFSGCEVYSGKIHRDVKLVVISVDPQKNRINAINNQDWRTLTYRLDMFEKYYKHEKELCFSRVVFKVCDDGDVVACLLDVPSKKYCVMSYMHVGQHGEARLDWCRGLKNAKPDEYAPIMKEMESLGYVLKVMKSFPRSGTEQ